LRTASFERKTDISYLPTAIAARIEMMVITISISSSENPAAQKPRREVDLRLPLFRKPQTVMW
jgi:hypothetical protein